VPEWLKEQLSNLLFRIFWWTFITVSLMLFWAIAEGTYTL